MKLLIDTNIVLEVILEQDKSEEVRTLLSKPEEHEFFITDYALHSIGLLLFRRKLHHVLRQFLHDMLINAGMMVAALPVEDMETVIVASEKFTLDFDDAYQYAVAEKYDYTLVSFDSDFDNTKRGRKTPAEVLQG
ncbi:MAG: type II toxin-antitoxin system VapC family toxin [Deltaproteobacteria bacterium]|nr:type II toxin-antitoxin system VapC family toxin [Deltaproteobacteria bacterium]